ncbi:hypothetical protein K432DRAFT_461853 [Lepidopterella palustris CBS 459.81]|uniref:Mitochondrial outer membrane protein OM14 C-terminal domain-containing protein n=1 Tax=Lepidopterella palustris CBS 459.81 TaxID=1314670 RepID=A0A8E2EHV3_9PEZI|nr:hypothetical protein K432DRAFT_461853 [Lepidopterella palustris CBS 459.81]
MSYAQAAASGPKQSPEEARAPPVPKLEHTDDSVSSLIDVDSPHISSVPSDYSTQSVKTDTQAGRLEREAEARERQAESAAADAKSKAEDAKDKAKTKAGRGANRARENADNPVVLGNAITVGLLGTALGVGAYRKYTAGELTWKVVGAWAGIVGLFAVGDYYVSQFLFKKYPPKK